MDAARYKAKKAILARRLKAARSLVPGNQAASFALFLSQLGLSPPSFILDDFHCVRESCSHAKIASHLEAIDEAVSPATILHSLPPEDALDHISCLMGMLKMTRMLMRFIQRFMSKPLTSCTDIKAAFKGYFNVVVDTVALDPAALARRRPKAKEPSKPGENMARVTHSLLDEHCGVGEFWDAMDSRSPGVPSRGGKTVVQRSITVDTRSQMEQQEQLATRMDLRQNQPRVTKRFVLLAELHNDRSDEAIEAIRAAFPALLQDVPGLTDVATGSCSCCMYETGESGDNGALVTYNFGVCCTFDDRGRAERYKAHPRHALAREQLLLPLLKRSPEESICILDCLDFLEVGQGGATLSTLPHSDFADVMSELVAAVQRNHDEVESKVREETAAEIKSGRKAQVGPRLRHQPQTEEEIQSKVLEALGGVGEIDDFMATHRVPKDRKALAELAQRVTVQATQRRSVGLELRSGPLHDVVGVANVMQRHRYDVHVQRKGCEALSSRVRAITEAARREMDVEDHPEGPSEDTADTRQIISAVVSSMRDFKRHKGIQRFGCRALSSLLETGSLVAIVSAGGVPAVLNSMQLMPGSEEVQGVGLGILGNSQLFDPRCLRVNSEQSIKATICAMDALPQSKMVAGLGSLALANLVYKDDSNVATLVETEGGSRVCRAMRAFPEVAQVQAACAWAIAALASKDGNLRQQVEENGGLVLCEDAASVHKDTAVLRNTRLAIRRIRALGAAGDDGDFDDGDDGDVRCVIS